MRFDPATKGGFNLNGAFRTVSHVRLTRLDQVPRRSHVVSIGTFDGVHRGHRHLLESAATRSGELGVPLLVVTFEPIPAQVIRPDTFPGRLLTADRKIDMLLSTGEIDLLVLPFTEALRLQTPEAFMENLHRFALPAELWVGEEFALGYNRGGTVDRLTAIGTGLGFPVQAVDRLVHDGEIISSSRIRAHILAGEPERAASLIGYLYSVAGEVIPGAQMGRRIGFPTANVVPPDGLVALPDGIYASFAYLPGELRPLGAVTYIGTRPALNSGNRLIETHILDFEGDLYGMQLQTAFVERLRPDATFESVDALIVQLQKDEAHARTALASRANLAGNA